MVVQTRLSSRDCSFRRDWCVLLLGFLWTMSGKCLWSLNCLTRLNLCNVFSSQSQNLCVFNWCYGFTKHCSVLHHHLSFCHRPNRSYTVCLCPPIHLLTGRFLISFSVCVCAQHEVSVRWSLSGQKKLLSFFLKQNARPECCCGHKAFFLYWCVFLKMAWCEESWYLK